jgi:hypothetical protein
VQGEHHSNVSMHQGSAIFGGHHHRFSRGLPFRALLFPLRQLLDVCPRMRRLNIVFHVAAFLAAFVSLILFVVGIFAASDKITHLLVK